MPHALPLAQPSLGPCKHLVSLESNEKMKKQYLIKSGQWSMLQYSSQCVEKL